MTIAVITIAVLFATAGATAIALALRISGLRSQSEEADERRADAEEKLKETAKDFADYKRRTEDQLDALRGDIEDLEDDLETCNTPGARRARLERLLSKTRSPT